MSPMSLSSSWRNICKSQCFKSCNENMLRVFENFNNMVSEVQKQNSLVHGSHHIRHCVISQICNITFHNFLLSSISNIFLHAYKQDIRNKDHDHINTYAQQHCCALVYFLSLLVRTMSNIFITGDWKEAVRASKNLT